MKEFEKDFVIYPIAIKMKELGFNEPCLAGYDDTEKLHIRNVDFQSDFKGFCLTPTYQHIFRWFRKNFHWTYKVNQVTKNNWSYTLENFPNDRNYYGQLYKSFEEAEIACVEKIIEFIKRK